MQLWFRPWPRPCRVRSVVASESSLVRLPSPHGCGGSAAEGPVELVARADPELAEDLVQVIFDGAAADEQARADLRVREAVAGKARDLGLLRGELVAGLDRALADARARGLQLASGPLRERLHSHRGEQVVSD